MQFRIPHPPRQVRLTQIPGALSRLARAAAVGLLLVGLLASAGRAAADLWVRERRFLARAEAVPGVVSQLRYAAAEGERASIDVLYEYGGVQRTGSRIPLTAEDARTLRHGMEVELLVDPSAPDHPREARLAREEGRSLDWLPYGLGLGLFFALAAVGWELRRTLRSDLMPLRQGLLVWLTPDGALPETRNEIVFAASYYREDVKYPVRARIRPGRAPVRNGEKVLAAVVPSQPHWARVIDEDLSKTLGWWG
ncbi:MAG: DUF3592 domain-containing protein [Myxococcota bacterium]|nr:DUF3592 domain-containing protein [Myxococcota bacterium]